MQTTWIMRAAWVVALGQAAIGCAVLAGVPAVIDRWPFPGTTPLTFTFVASILLAAAASTAWCVLSDQPAGLAGVGVDYLTILIPFTAFLAFADVADRGALIVAIAPTLVFGLWLTVTSRRADGSGAPTPRPVRIAFVVFATLLILVAGALVMGRDVLPWPVTEDLSVVVGLMFFGAAGYFIVGAIRGTWAHAGGQLAGFLAYDLVLIGPLAAKIGDVPQSDATSLAIYLTVIITSGLLAGWYLINPPQPD